MDQLLLGTILFTLLVFLFPTVAVFYALFVFSRVVVILVQACLEIALAMLNHFPLFAVMLRVKDPKRLPGGIRFTVIDKTRATIYLLVQSVPLGSERIFYQYMYLINDAFSRYFNVGIVRGVLVGEHLKPMRRLQVC